MEESQQVKDYRPMYGEVVDAYLSGKLTRPKGDFVYYHISEERKALGDKYIIWDHWENFVRGVELGQEHEKLKFKALWKT